MNKKTSIFSICILSLFLAILLSPAKSYAISIEPVGPWNLTLNTKDIFPASEAPGPPDGALGRAEAKRAFGTDADTGAAATISASNFTADPLVIKASAKVTNDSTKMDGVSAKTSVNFSRIYKTKQLLSSGSFNVNVRGVVKAIEGTLTTQNPFFHPIALMDFEIQIFEVDQMGDPLGGPFAPVVKLNFLTKAVDILGPFAWTGDDADPGRKTTKLKSPFKGKAKFKKKVNETKFIRVAGVLGVGASISAVDSLAVRLFYLHTFLEFLELGAPNAILSPDELAIRAGRYINLGTGVLTPLGMSGFADADFFSSIDLTVDATDIVAVPEPGTLALFCTGLLGLGLARRRKKV